MNNLSAQNQENEILRTCHDCGFYEPDFPELDYCGHDDKSLVMPYVDHCIENQSVFNADRCPGFFESDLD